MWARGTPQPEEPGSGGLSGLITRDITNCDSVPELETVFIEYGSNFSYVNASAALVKYAKLRGSSMHSPFFSKLAAVWLQRLPEAEQRQCANVLWACSKLGSAKHPVWAPTWQRFNGLVAKDLSGDGVPSVQPQELSNVLYACATLCKQPQSDELLLLLEAFLHPGVLAAAAPQAIANVIWALGLLSITPGWEAKASHELLQQLLAPQVLLTVAVDGVPQAASNVLMGLARMCTGPSPLLSTAAAREHAQQLLAGIQPRRVSSWGPRDISNAMWAFGELQLKNDELVSAAVAAAPRWLPQCNDAGVSQAATACARLQHRDEDFMRLLLQRGEHLLQQGGRSRGLSNIEKASLVALCCVSVALLDMRGLAGAACTLVASSNIMQNHQTGRANLRRLWVFHSWLLEHQLLDGRGLVGLMTEQQLQLGARESAAWQDKTRL
jgi:hypothetical protein